MMLAGRLLRGGVVVYGSFLTGKILTFASSIVLARLLLPSDLGLVAYALLILSFFDALKSVDLGSALIYRQEDPESAASEIFVLAVISATACYAACWLLAPLAAEFFHSARVIEVIRVLGLTLVIDALGEVHAALMLKNMRFARRHIPRLLMHITKGVVSIVLAFAGLGVFSLVYGQVAASLVGLLAIWWIFPWRPRLHFRWLSARDSLAYGVRGALVGLLGVAAFNAGGAVVGRMLGDSALGLYDLAVTVPQILILYVATAISQVAFPLLSRLQQDRVGLPRAYLEVQRCSALIVMPLGLGVCVVAPAFVETAFTRVWWPVIPAMQAIAIYSTISAVTWTAGDLFKATARLGIQWKVDLAYLVILVPVLVLGGLLGGLAGTALAQTLVVLPFRMFSLWLVHRYTGVTFAAMLRAVRVPILAGAMLVAVCILVAWALMPRAEPWIQLCVQVGAGASMYVAGVLVLDADLRAQMRSRWAAFLRVWRSPAVVRTAGGQLG